MQPVQQRLRPWREVMSFGRSAEDQHVGRLHHALGVESRPSRLVHRPVVRAAVALRAAVRVEVVQADADDLGAGILGCRCRTSTA